MAQGAATKVKKRKKSVIKRAKQSHVRAEINRANTHSRANHHEETAHGDCREGRGHGRGNFASAHAVRD